jgi:elongation factor 1-beta
MYNVVATIRVLPESPEVDREALKREIEKTIPTTMALHKIEEEPIAFGLVALNLIILTTDKEGGDTTLLEDALRNLPNVSGVEVTDVRRTVG